MRAWACWLALALAPCALPSLVRARANVVSMNTGAGFSDTTKVAPVGGNPGTTLGEQRRLALEHAFGVWGALLDSAVPITIDVTFDDVECGNGMTVLGQAGNTSVFTNLIVAGADPRLFYPSALANSLVGRDLDPTMPDIEMTLNSAVDSKCKQFTQGFYYGFDGRAGEAQDFLSVVLHELAHGLGFSSLVDPETGELAMDRGVDPYTANIRDLDLDKTWADLTPAQRKQSALNVRRLAWDGPHAAQLVPQQFSMGHPTLAFDTPVMNFSGFVSDADVGRNSAQLPASGRVVMVDSCAMPQPALSGLVALMSGTCFGAALLDAAKSGAVGALLELTTPYDAPALPVTTPNLATTLALPVLTLSPRDAQSVEAALKVGELRASLAGDAQRRLGADDKQRPLLFASRPVDRGSSISHLEALVRPDQLMEPIASPVPTQDLSFTLAMLLDIGWSARCGDGHKDPGEECDEGAKNSDSVPDGCRRDCRRARCGDGVRDAHEGCDNAVANSDELADACRTTCALAACGDGVLDRDEQCDRGKLNSDRAPDGCRTRCQTAHCGDNVIDSLEQCDHGSDNSDQTPDACRGDCRVARCGDGVVDSAEQCDDAARNSDTLPDACRRGCTRPHCGDSVVDRGEACDGTPDCSAACELLTPRGGADAGLGADAGAAPKPKASGCGCRISDRGAHEHPCVFGIACVLACFTVRRRMNRSLQRGTGH